MTGSKLHSSIRDQTLLDGLEKVGQQPYSGIVWRSVREGRDPIACWRAGGRWDDGAFDVLYTSQTREAALEERRFHLFQGQPIPPSKVRYELFELRISLQAAMVFDGLDQLAALGLNISGYGQLSYTEREQEYPRSQEIAEACMFLGADGILVPSARDHASNNLVIFCDQETRMVKEVVRNHGIVDFRR